MATIDTLNGLAMFKSLLLLPLTLLLSACSLTQYSVTEQQINDYLASRAGFEKRLGIPGIMSSQIRLGEMKSHIGRSAPDKVDLDTAGDLVVASPMGQQSLKIRLTLRARPDYVPAQGAIYLKDLELLSVKTEPADVGAALTPLLPMFSLSLGQFLDETPVYRLNEQRSKNEALARDKVDGLKVEPGKLVIPFKLL